MAIIAGGGGGGGGSRCPRLSVWWGLVLWREREGPARFASLQKDVGGDLATYMREQMEIEKKGKYADVPISIAIN